MKHFILALILVAFLSTPALARRCNRINTDTPSDKTSAQVGAGIDVLLYNDKNIDLVGEYKYDWNNAGHEAYVVVKTNKSVVQYIKDIFKKKDNPYGE